MVLILTVIYHCKGSSKLEKIENSNEKIVVNDKSENKNKDPYEGVWYYVQEEDANKMHMFALRSIQIKKIKELFTFDLNRGYGEVYFDDNLIKNCVNDVCSFTKDNSLVYTIKLVNNEHLFFLNASDRLENSKKVKSDIKKNEHFVKGDNLNVDYSNDWWLKK